MIKYHHIRIRFESNEKRIRQSIELNEIEDGDLISSPQKINRSVTAAIIFTMGLTKPATENDIVIHGTTPGYNF